jgi:predicted Zn-dependent peptidase
LAYNVSGGGSADAASSAFSFGGSVTPDNAPELMKLVAHELKDVKEGGLEPAELEVAKDRVIGRRELAHQTPGSLLNYYLGDYDLEEVVRPYYEEIEQIRAVTVEDVIRAARHVFSSGQWGISWLGDLDEAKAAEYTEPIAKLFS